MSTQAHTHTLLKLNKDGDGSLSILVKIQQVFKRLYLKLWWINFAFVLCFIQLCLLNWYD